MTFGLIYAFTENFVLPLSHDEVVHGKGSLLGKMPGDRWQQFANLRAYYGFMCGHPGKKLLFMGGEFAQDREWNHDASLDWHLLRRQPHHAGVQRLVRDLNRALPRTAGAAPARLRAATASSGSTTTTPSTRVLRLRAPRRATATPCVVRLQLHAGAAPRLPHRRAARRAAGAKRSTPTPRYYGGSNVGNAAAARCTASRCRRTAAPQSLVLTCRRWPRVFLRPLSPHLTADGRACARSRGTALAAGRHVRRRRRQLRGVLGARHAVELCLFDPTASARSRALPLPDCTDDVWHGYLPGARPGPGLRPARARALRPDAATASTRTSCCSTRTRARSSAAALARRRTTATDRRAPATALRPARQRRRGAEGARRRRPLRLAATTAPPHTPLADTVLYELHVAASRCCIPACPTALRGTYAGLAHAARHRALEAPGRHRGRACCRCTSSSTSRAWSSAACVNYWGYNTLGFFCPEPRYRARRTTTPRRRVPTHGAARCTPPASRCMLDVVYNHTAERRRARPDASASAASTTPASTACAPDDRRCYDN